MLSYYHLWLAHVMKLSVRSTLLCILQGWNMATWYDPLIFLLQVILYFGNFLIGDHPFYMVFLSASTVSFFQGSVSYSISRDLFIFLRVPLFIVLITYDYQLCKIIGYDEYSYVRPPNYSSFGQCKMWWHVDRERSSTLLLNMNFVVRL